MEYLIALGLIGVAYGLLTKKPQPIPVKTKGRK